MKGGYQILDLSNVTVGTQATIDGIYNLVSGNNEKPLLIVTPDNQRVFSEVKAGTNKFVSAYLGADGSTYEVEIKSTNKVDITKVPSDAETAEKVEEIEERLDANLLKGAYIDISTYDSDTPYVAPSDGYVTVLNGSGGTGQVEIKNDVNTFYSMMGSVTGIFSLFVRKGTTLYVSGTSTSKVFVPLV